MKRYESSRSKCPFYRSETQQKVYCEGVEDGTSIHLAFDTTAHANEFKQYYCSGRYMACPIAVMLNDKYRED